MTQKDSSNAEYQIPQDIDSQIDHANNAIEKVEVEVDDYNFNSQRMIGNSDLSKSITKNLEAYKKDLSSQRDLKKGSTHNESQAEDILDIEDNYSQNSDAFENNVDSNP
jgi:hypothetical protein